MDVRFEPTGLPLIPVAKGLGITMSAFVVGATAASTSILLPVIRSASSEPRISSAQWRHAQQLDFLLTVPAGLLAGLTWTFLALTSPRHTVIRAFYTVTAIVVPAAAPVAILAHRKTNGTVGYPLKESDGDEPTEDILRSIDSWSSFGFGRMVVLAAATAIGTVAAFNETFLHGVQAGAGAII